MVHISNINTLKSIYLAYLHSITKYGIIFWGNSFNGRKIFTLPNKIVRIMAGALPRNSGSSLFKWLEILPVPWQYILLLMNFIIKYKKIFRQIHLCTILIQGISNIFIDHMPTYLSLKKKVLFFKFFLLLYHAVW
jgi:hypothetical protein